MRKTPNIGLNDYRGNDYVKRENFVEDNFILDEKIQGLEDSKQDKEEGKGLSSNDYTTAEKNKLASITVGSDIPKGLISMWSGLIEAIPTGWTLCNGENGTPNLTDRFIVGAGEDYDIGDTGGLNNVSLTTSQLPSHTHGSGTLSASSDGSHSHGRGTLSVSSAGGHTHTYSAMIQTTAYKNMDEGSQLGIRNSTSETTNSSGAHSHTISGSTASGGSHSHTISGSTGTAGSGSSHENRPPYFALAFIMKL